MGFTATLYALAENEYNNLPDDEIEVIGMLFPADIYSNPRFCNLDKGRSMLHYLLCGSTEPNGSVLGDAIMGGESTAIEMDYGPARYRSPARIVEINQALSAVSLEKCHEKLDASSAALKDVYLADEFVEEGIDAVQGFFDELRAFYAQAASENQAALSYLA